jgi:hypothetical protein
MYYYLILGCNREKIDSLNLEYYDGHSLLKKRIIYRLLIVISIIPFIVSGGYSQWYSKIPVVLALKTKCLFFPGLILLLLASSVPFEPIINSCFATVVFLCKSAAVKDSLVPVSKFYIKTFLHLPL